MEDFSAKVAAELRKSMDFAWLLLATRWSAGVGITATPEEKKKKA